MSSHAQQQPSRPLTPSEIHHALLRPAILQILRAQGYYSSTPGTVDAVTELAGSYLGAIARRAAQHAALHPNPDAAAPPAAPTLTDVRLALEECGALWPERELVSQELRGEEDTRGVDDFIRWATGRKNLRIRKVAGVAAPPPAGGGASGATTTAAAVSAAAAAAAEAEEEGIVEERPTDYLDALKRKHNKTDQDSKYAGTILGKSTDHGEVLIEGGGETSLAAWAQKMHDAAVRPPRPSPEADPDSPRPPSSGLSSLTDGDVDMIMDFES
ncbi:hypothetical protein F5X96DRAFT_692790 [Biscogniauxia mediterranea]|nr:hypothetical protein F5X96DRAFT_692790 [Biscogniauxia mediterranea]